MKGLLPKVSLIGAVALLAVACGKEKNKGYKVRPELLRTEGTTFSAYRYPLAASALNADRYAWTSNIDIKSLKIPITSIVLSEYVDGSGSKNPQIIYGCAADCNVELMGPALTNLLKDQEVTITGTGTFQKIVINYGAGDTLDWQGKIAAEFTLGGIRYYTKATGELSTTGPAEEVAYDGFGSGSVSFLPSPIELKKQESDPESMAIKLYFDPLFTAYAVDRSKVSPSSFPDAFCVGSAVGVRLCTQRLVVAASTQAVAPTRERYMINSSALASLFFDNGDTPVGGNLVAVLTEGVAFQGMSGGVDTTEVGLDMSKIKMWASGPVFGFAKNSDGSYLVSTIVGEANPANEDGGFRAKAFMRVSHSGKFETSAGNEYDYSALPY